MGDFSSVLLSYEKALESQQQCLSFHSLLLAEIYNNIAYTHQSMGFSSNVLSYFEKTLETQQKFLPSAHPGLALNYNNIATVH
jgi:tetratricopeptide (TPR) repeat protein